MTEFSMKKLEDMSEVAHPEVEYGGTTFRIMGKDLGVQHFVMTMAIIKPGERIPLHSHKTAEEVHLLVKGRSKVIVENQTFDVQATTAFRFPPGTNTALINDSKEDASWVFIGAPLDDYKATYVAPKQP